MDQTIFPQPSRSNRIWIFPILSLLIFSGIVVYTIQTWERLDYSLGHLGFYFILGTFFIWVAYSYRYLSYSGFSLGLFFRKNWMALLSSFVLILVLHFSAPPRFMTLSDETNLLSTAKSMLEQQTTYNTIWGKFYYDFFSPIRNEIPGRPLLFSFLTYLVSLIRGYHYQNGFIANAVVLYSFLVSVFIIVQRYLGLGFAFSALFLIAANPVLVISASSAGFDFTASVCIFLTLLSLWIFIQKRDSITFSFLWVNLLLICHTRYESFSVCFLVALGLLILGYINRRLILENWVLMSFTPFTFLPVIWQRILLGGSFPDKPAHLPLFGWVNFVSNFPRFLQSQFSPGFELPYPVFTNWIGVFCMFILFGAWVLNGFVLFRDQKKRHFSWIATAVIASNLLIYLFWFFGDGTQPAAARFFVFFTSVCLLMPFVLMVHFPALRRWQPVLIGSLLLFCISHPITIHGRFISTLTLIRETEFEYDFLDTLKGKNQLIISDRPGQVIAYGVGAADFTYFRDHQDELLYELNRHLYSGIYVFQHIQYSTGLPAAAEILPPKIALETIAERQNSAEEFIRISRILKNSEHQPSRHSEK